MACTRTISVLKNSHETIASRFIDITVGFVNTIQKGGKIAFNQRIEHLGGKLLTQAGVATDVEKQDRHVLLVLRQRWCLGVGGNEALDGLGHKLGKVIFNPPEFAELTVDRMFEP